MFVCAANQSTIFEAILFIYLLMGLKTNILMAVMTSHSQTQLAVSKNEIHLLCSCCQHSTET